MVIIRGAGPPPTCATTWCVYIVWVYMVWARFVCGRGVCEMGPHLLYEHFRRVGLDLQALLRRDAGRRGEVRSGVYVRSWRLAPRIP